MLFTGFHWGIVSKAYGASDVIQVTSQRQAEARQRN
jgi:hypothetical protein